MKGSDRSVIAALVLGAALTGCAAKARPGDVLAARLADLMPHGDRDHFVYVSQRSLPNHEPQVNLTVDHVSALDRPGEFQVTESSDGERLGDSRWIADERGIALVSEEVDGLGVHVAYDPPLLLFPQPLVAGEHRAEATGAATSLDDGKPMGVFRASAVVKSSPTRTTHPLASGDAVLIEMTRSLVGPHGALVLHSDTVSAEGVGEIESIAALEGVPIVVRRSLVCGFIQGRAIGRCDELK